ncbi:MAG: serine hydrolase [Thermoleophilia bacterium]
MSSKRSSTVTVKAADEQLATALAPIVKHHTGNFAVGVIDHTTGISAVYDGTLRVHTASIVKVDILATLLLQHQAAGTSLSADERETATEMIENSNNDAATALWDEVGKAAGVTKANRVLGLRETTLGEDGYWGLTSTTVSDQLKLLGELLSSSSPLSLASRTYELGLMRHIEPEQDWGVNAAATAGTSAALKTGLLPDPQLLVVNSIGIIEHGGQEFLVAVLSNDQPTQAIGVSEVKAVAVAAVNAVSAVRS